MSHKKIKNILIAFVFLAFVILSLPSKAAWAGYAAQTVPVENPTAVPEEEQPGDSSEQPTPAGGPSSDPANTAVPSPTPRVFPTRAENLPPQPQQETQPANQPADQSAEQAADQSADQPANQPASSTPVEQPTTAPGEAAARPIAASLTAVVQEERSAEAAEVQSVPLYCSSAILAFIPVVMILFFLWRRSG